MSINVWKGSRGSNIFKSFFRKIKYSVQRIRSGYCDWDSWDLSEYFSSVIPNALRKLANDTIGVPAEFCPVDDFDDGSSSLAKWKAQIVEIADLIEYGANISDCDSDEEYLERKEKLKEGLDLLNKYFYHLWW